MTVTLTLPDDVAQRLEAAAAARGVSVEQLAVEVLSGVDSPPVTAEGRSALEAFVGSGAGDGSSFDIHEARHELAERRLAGGARGL
jgi:plasmid stability protein